MTWGQGAMPWETGAGLRVVGISVADALGLAEAMGPVTPELRGNLQGNVEGHEDGTHDTLLGDRWLSAYEFVEYAEFREDQRLHALLYRNALRMDGAAAVLLWVMTDDPWWAVLSDRRTY